MHGNLTPYKPQRTHATRRPWWQRSYAWNIWKVWGLGLLFAFLLLAAHITVSIIEGLT